MFFLMPEFFVLLVDFDSDAALAAAATAVFVFKLNCRLKTQQMKSQFLQVCWLQQKFDKCIFSSLTYIVVVIFVAVVVVVGATEAPFAIFAHGVVVAVVVNFTNAVVFCWCYGSCDIIVPSVVAADFDVFIIARVFCSSC